MISKRLLPHAYKRLLPTVLTLTADAIEPDTTFGDSGVLETRGTSYYASVKGVYADDEVVLMHGLEEGWGGAGNIFIKKFDNTGELDTSFGIGGHYKSDVSNVNDIQRNTVSVYDIKKIGNDLKLLLSTQEAAHPLNAIARLTPAGLEQLPPERGQGINTWDAFKNEYWSGGILSDGRIWCVHRNTHAFGIVTASGYPNPSFGNDGWVGTLRDRVIRTGEGTPIELASGNILLGDNKKILLIDPDGNINEDFDSTPFFSEISSLLGAGDSEFVGHKDAYELPSGVIRILGIHIRSYLDGGDNSTFIADMLPTGELVSEGRFRFVEITNSGFFGVAQKFLPNGSIAQLKSLRYFGTGQTRSLEIIDPLNNFERVEFNTGGPMSGFNLSGNDIFAWTTTAEQSNDKKFRVLKYILSDTDKDGIEDEAELKLGTAVDMPDTDEDGLTDFEELVLWELDPLKPDTDNDGFSDGFEVQAGFDPTDADSKPSASIEIHPAVEISINAELGKTYTLQHSTDMNDWTDSGATVVGTGRAQNFYRPTTKQQMKYWRVVEVK
jgi:hypothetical protein